MTVILDPDASGYLARCADFARRTADLHGANKEALFTALAAAGATHVDVSFDGCGDSGQIESVEVRAGEVGLALPSTPVELFQADFSTPDVRRREMPLPEAIEHLVYGFLGETHAGWEDNDGAYGDVLFDVSARIIILQYNERYIASEYSEHVL